MPIIDNSSQTMQEALVNSLVSADRVDIEVAFFYFSGWKLLSKYLKDKKIRLLIGKYIDPAAVPELLQKIRQEGTDVDLDPFQPRHSVSSRTAKKKTYIDGFTRLSNESALLDDSDSQEAYKILEDKIRDGSLEMKLSNQPHHGKMYILHRKQNLSEEGDLPGTVFMGSSNFTFQGLINQGELNRRDSNKSEYLEYVEKFEEHWKNSENIDIANLENKDDLLDCLKKDLWIHSNPDPYKVYIRVLYELFGKETEHEIKTPYQITNGQYSDLEYQTDAIKSVLDKIDRYDGVILADVVGLGKSIIAAAAANNLGLTSIIIAPPHLKDQWENYQAEFRLPGARVFSSGTVENIYKKYKDNDSPMLIIIDEAHRYRNEDTYDYRMLHKICHSHPDNKVMLLTATPFNNDPKDVFALIKLFQLPGQSTIRSVDNLSLRFRELIERYKKLNRDRLNKKIDQQYIDDEADRIALELRRLIENVLIRRSRLDLRTITRYRKDLEKQNIDFAEVIGPELLKYDLGDLLDLYSETLFDITGDENHNGLIGARYKPATYVKDREAFIKKYGKDLDESDLKTAQVNLAEFMKRLLVMRFESSKYAFKSTLEKIIASNELIERWWQILGKVPIMKKGQIPDPELILESSDDSVDKELDQQTSEDEIEKVREIKGLISVDASMIKEGFIVDVQKDLKLLKEIYEKWFGPKAMSIKDLDPKLDNLKEKIDQLLLENKDRKIVIFSTYADTVNYLYEQLNKKGLRRILKYTSADASKSMKQIIRCNFDAGIKAQEQANDYDVLIATDALSEGYNLHRAGVVINYDIPYNPTRVIQRIGRINRINKRVFDNLYIYNCFPTETGEQEIRIKQVTTLKMRLIASVMGIDTKTLTEDEKLQSFLKEEYLNAEKDNAEVSWDALHREAYDQVKNNTEFMAEVLSIKPRSRVVRTKQKDHIVVAFGKKGDHSIFALKNSEPPEIVPAERALNVFKTTQDEKGQEADEQYDEVFKLVRDLLFEKHKLPAIRGRRGDALAVLKEVENKLPQAKDYCRDLSQIIKKYDGINDGDLKFIAQLVIVDPNEAFINLQEIVPVHQITSIIEKAEKQEGEHETILISEELRV